MARYKKRTSKAATIAAIIAVVISILCAFAIILGIITDWYTDFGKFKRKGGGDSLTANADTLYAPDAGLLIGQTTSDGIMLYSAATPLADFEKYSLDENVEAVKTITARIVPEDATLQQVDYTAAWKNAASEWATGKDVNDYITLTQSSDGSLDCAVSLIDAIGEQIIITCTARPLEEGDITPSATCTVDYYKRTRSVSMSFIAWSGNYEMLLAEVCDGATLNFTDYFYDETDDSISSGHEFKLNQVLSVGTVSDTPKNIAIKISFSDKVAQSVKNAANVSQLGDFSPINANGTTNGLYLNTELTKILGGASNIKSHQNAIYTVLKTAYDEGTPALKADISYTGTLTGLVYKFTYNMYLNPLALGVKAQKVEIDKPGIIFSLKRTPNASNVLNVTY